jgi:hypothetical protein
MAPLIECVLSIAPLTAQVAAREADENARTARPGRLPLDTKKDFIYAQPLAHVAMARLAASSASSITSLRGV